MDKLRDDVDAVRAHDSGDERATTERYRVVPRAPKSAAVLVANTRTTHSAPAATATVPPPVSTPLAHRTSDEAFVDALLSMPSMHQSHQPEVTFRSC